MGRWNPWVDIPKRILQRENAKYVPGRPVRNAKKETAWFVVGSILMGLIVAVEIVERDAVLSAPFWRGLVAMGVLLLIAILLLVYNLNYSISFESSGLKYRNIWRRTRDMPYKNITRYGIEKSWGVTSLVVYVEEKKYRFSPSLVGFKYLHEQIRENVGRDKEKNLTFLE